MTTLPAFALQQFRTQRAPVLNSQFLLEIYSNPLYEPDIVFRQKTRGFPSLCATDVAPLAPVKRPIEPPPCSATRTALDVVSSPDLGPQKPKRSREETPWCQRFAPLVWEDLYGIRGTVTRSQEWLRCDWKKTFLLVTGASGTGKSSLARLLLPGAETIDFNTYSSTRFQLALIGSGTLSSPKSRGLILHDLFTLPELAQKFIRDSLVYFYKHDRGCPVPVAIVLDDITPAFSVALARFFTRVTVYRPSKKILMSLGYSILRRAGLADQRFSSNVAAVAAVAANPRQYITYLQKSVCSRERPFSFFAADCHFSPFDLVRQVWCSARPRSVAAIARDDSDGNLASWLSENTVALVIRHELRAAFCDDVSLVDAQRRLLFPRSTALPQYLAILAGRVAVSENGYGDACLLDLAVAYPKSLRSLKEPEKPALAAVSLAQGELNRCW